MESDELSALRSQLQRAQEELAAANEQVRLERAEKERLEGVCKVLTHEAAEAEDRRREAVAHSDSLATDGLACAARVSALEQQLQEEQARAAAMREAIESALNEPITYEQRWDGLTAALASPAGREYAERMQRYEAALRETIAAVKKATTFGEVDDALDIARRALGETK